ncbi:Calcium-dependent protein kinase 4 [Hypsizygus marmoreus]|uniref:Calcium-dependent protein kinase 4 n=1 Tax=Hypsizygus marmoreus TaxID=39966 RepID=A0A369JN07_HYPMA|nr:Calcium-dependent protein kinase 4 [Hypsizygus marmoreus]
MESHLILFASLFAGTCLVTAAYHLYPKLRRQWAIKAIRDQLPLDLDTWRMPGSGREDEERVWQVLDPVLRQRGLKPWSNSWGCTLKSPDDNILLSNGYAYVTKHRQRVGTLASAMRLQRFQYLNPLIRIVRTPDDHDMAVRVITVKGEGHNHLSILRKIATGHQSLIQENHALPMLAEFSFEDITFGMFPKVGGTMQDAFCFWAKNSVGDILDMLMQALEGLAFIHDLNIAHRDAFHNNFLVQWQPESLITQTHPVCRPRVYLIDFEVAVEFSAQQPMPDRLVTGYPLGGSFTDLAEYSRPCPPEMKTLKPYSPFKLDVWQLGQSFDFVQFKTTIPSIDLVISSLVDPDWETRPSAQEALERMIAAVCSLPPTALLIPPSIVDPY